MAVSRHLPHRQALLALAAAAFTTAAASLTALNHVKDAAIADSLNGRGIHPLHVLAALRPLDLAWLALAALTVAVLAWLQLRRHAFTSLLTGATDAEAFITLTILLCWLGHAYLSPGVLLGGDMGTHISRFNEVRQGLNAGMLSPWTNYQYIGEPLLWFTGPLTYVVGGVVAYLLQDATAAAKLLLFGLHVASGWAYYALLRRLGSRAVPAVVVACCFAGCFAHLHLFLFRGVLPQAFTILLVVLLFHAADGLMRGRGARWANVVVFALATAGSIVNHQPHALFTALYLALFGGVALLTGLWRWRGLPVLVVAGVLGAVASAVAVLPVLGEAGWVMIEPDGALFRLHLPTITRLLNLVLWRDTRTTWAYDYWAYLGIGLVGLSAAGIVALARSRLQPGRRALAIPACVCLALAFVLYNPVVRDIIFLMFFAGLLADLGLAWLLEAPRIPAGWKLGAVTLVLLDLASTSIQPVLRTDKMFLMAAGAHLEQIAPTSRVMQVALDASQPRFLIVDGGPDSGPLSYAATVQRIAGNHNMAATRVHNVLFSAVKLTQEDLVAHAALSPATRALLGVLNVGAIICNTAIANGCPASFADTAEDPVLGRYVPVAGSPALFSQHLATVPIAAGLIKPMFWDKEYTDPGPHPRITAMAAVIGQVLGVEHPDMQTRLAGAIAMPGPVPANQPTTPGWHPAVTDYQVSLNHVRLAVTANGDGYVQISHPWFPSTVVTVNGQTMRPLDGTLGLMVLPIHAGASIIAWHEGSTPLRDASLAISVAGLVLIGSAGGGLAWGDRRRRLLPPNPPDSPSTSKTTPH